MAAKFDWGEQIGQLLAGLDGETLVWGMDGLDTASLGNMDSFLTVQ